MTSKPASAEEQLSSLFGSYKAEWLKGRMFELFTEPAYFPDLITSRPCLLIGGRGTGKTTVLRCMSYEGQFVRSGSQADRIAEWPYYGVYYRVNTNRVSAFQGPELPAERWVRAFAHYFNLVLCEGILRFLEWYRIHIPSSEDLSALDWELIATSLHLAPTFSASELLRAVRKSIVSFEAYINNVADGEAVPLSLQGAPVDALLQSLMWLPQFTGKSFFFLLDEYENFEDYQQQIVNTLIKHSGESYTFKVGVRELGWRVRTTLNANEQLISPADYVRVHIAEKLDGERFAAFADAVISERMARIETSVRMPKDIRLLFPGLTDEEEAEVLDRTDEGPATRAALELSENVPEVERAILNGMPLLEKYFLVVWARAHGMSLTDCWRSYVDSPSMWSVRYGNFKHSLLFAIRKGKRGIRKYYAGWSVFVQLSAMNIRYLLELVDQSLLVHIRNGRALDAPVSPDMQTLVAQQVGKKNLAELEGLTVHGARLTKLLLGLGRIFQELAANSEGHAPEITQFHLADEGRGGTIREDVDRLLTAAVMHLALLRFSGSKPGDERDTRDYDYAVHPIFSPFFVFPHRKKRKMLLTGQQLLGLVSRPRTTIREILADHNRQIPEDLPDQMLLFEAYYRDEQ
ncbi:MAG: hypothetical protein ABUT39_18640 [Acidobacteriota bacterium]